MVRVSENLLRQITKIAKDGATTANCYTARMTNASDPIDDQDLVTKGYLESSLPSGSTILLDPVLIRATYTGSGGYEEYDGKYTNVNSVTFCPETINGHTLSAGDRIFLTHPTYNGIWVADSISAPGFWALVRASDMAEGSTLSADKTYIIPVIGTNEPFSGSASPNTYSHLIILNVSANTTVTAGPWTNVTIWQLGDYVSNNSQGEIEKYPTDASSSKQYVLTTIGIAGGTWTQINETVADALIIDNAIPLEKLNDGDAIDNQILGYTSALGWHPINNSGGSGSSIELHEPVTSIIYYNPLSAINPTSPGNYINNNTAAIGDSFFFISPKEDQGIYEITNDTTDFVVATRRDDWYGNLDMSKCHIVPLLRAKDIGTEGGLVYTPNYGPDAMHWVKKTTNTVPNITRHTSVVFNNKIWILGGVDATGTRTNNVWSSSDGETWTNHGAAGWSARAYHTSLVFDNKIWVIGGIDYIPFFKNDVWYSSDGLTWTQATASASFVARSHLSSVTFDNKMWVLGGINSSNVYLNDVWYSTNGSSWTRATAAAAWSARRWFPTISFNNKMRLYGGVDSSSSYYNDSWSSSDGITWTQDASDSEWSNRGGHSVVTDETSVWLLGGTIADLGKNDIWKSTDGYSWNKVQLEPPWSPRYAFSSVLFNNRIWVICGNHSTGASKLLYLNDVYCGTTSSTVEVGTDAADISTTTNDTQYGVGSIIIHPACSLSSTTNISNLYACPKVMDGDDLVAGIGMRVFLGKQTLEYQNGIYEVVYNNGTGSVALERASDWAPYSTLRQGTTHLIPISGGHLWGGPHIVSLYISSDFVINPGTTATPTEWRTNTTIIGPFQDVIDETIAPDEAFSYKFNQAGVNTFRKQIRLLGEVVTGEANSLSFDLPTQYLIPFETNPMSDDLGTTWTTNIPSIWSRSTTRNQGNYSWYGSTSATVSATKYIYRTVSVPAGHKLNATFYSRRVLSSGSITAPHGIKIGIAGNDATYGESFTDSLNTWSKLSVTTNILNMSSSTTVYITLYSTNSTTVASYCYFDGLQIVTWAAGPSFSTLVYIDAVYYPTGGNTKHNSDSQLGQIIDSTNFWGDDKMIEFYYYTNNILIANVLKLERHLRLSVQAEPFRDNAPIPTLPTFGTPAPYPY